MKMNFNGMAIGYDDVGEGRPPLVLIHGFPLSRQIWKPQLSALQNHYRVIAPDLRGHGESGSAGGVYMMETLADEIHALMQKLDCGPAIIAGHSMGGYVVFAFYRKYPEWVQGLVLVSTRAVSDSEEGRANRETLAKRAEQEGAKAVIEKMLPGMLSETSVTVNPNLKNEVESIMAATSVNGLTGALRGMAVRMDASDLLPKISIPTLILSGTADKLIPHAESEAMAKAIPGAQLQLIEGAGHLLSLEKPEAFTHTLRAWLELQAWR
jgi:pimeloyl-ACP methyl ester carboxylesterase